MKRYGKWLATGGLFAACILVFSSVGWAQSTGLDELIAAAKKEGTITLYNAVPNTSDEVAKAFEKAYGIKVIVLTLPSGSLLQRFSSEAQAKAPTADVIVTVSLDRSAPELVQKGWLQPISSSGIPSITNGDFPARFVSNNVATVNFMPFVVAYNTDAIKADQAPKEISDLTNPKYQGQLLLIDPATSESHVQLWDKVRQSLGDGVLKGIANNKPQLYASATAVAEALAAGEGSVAITTGPGLSKIVTAGAPVAFTTPQVTTGAEMQVALAGTPAHPAAGKLMVNFLLTSEGNAILSKGIIGVRDRDISPDRLVTIRPNENALQKKDELFGLLGLTKK